MEGEETLLKEVLENCSGKPQLHQLSQVILMQNLNTGIRGNPGYKQQHFQTSPCSPPHTTMPFTELIGLMHR